MIYRIGLTQTVVEEATVFIEAASLEEAEELALKRANDGVVEWRFLEAPEPIEIVTVDRTLCRSGAGVHPRNRRVSPPHSRWNGLVSRNWR
jgi:hypothetical protein